MVLKENLLYYEDKETYLKNKDPKGVIKLDSFLCIRKDGENSEFEFTIFAVPKPTVCHAESKAESDDWCRVITHLANF